jgi:hypothetical protein
MNTITSLPHLQPNLLLSIQGPKQWSLTRILFFRASLTTLRNLASKTPHHTVQDTTHRILQPIMPRMDACLSRSISGTILDILLGECTNILQGRWRSFLMIKAASLTETRILWLPVISYHDILRSSEHMD